MKQPALKKKIAVIFGTRPDTIKLAPVIQALRREPSFFDVVTIATAQHRTMLDQVLTVFDIVPDYDLNIMQSRQSLAPLTSNTLSALDSVLEKEKPDMVLVQGDTTTTFVGSLAAFYRAIPVGHVEAGLRTRDKLNPFPEEINRRLTSSIADLHFAPTATARRALVTERQNNDSIFVTGNSVIDALKFAVKKPHRFSHALLHDLTESKSQRLVLITMHRRENWGEPMRSACEAVKRLAGRFPDVHFVFPVHLNPVVRDVVQPILGACGTVHLLEPLDYMDFVHLMARSYLIITDSGGIQEEGPALGKPVLVLRTVTERPEAVRYGTVKLVGLDENRIFKTAQTLIGKPSAYRAMASATNPYGDGKTSERIVAVLKNYFGLSRKRVKEFSPKSRR